MVRKPLYSASSMRYLMQAFLRWTSLYMSCIRELHIYQFEIFGITRSGIKSESQTCNRHRLPEYQIISIIVQHIMNIFRSFLIFRINGVPACANKKLLTDILRKEWGFKGYVISDQAAIENIIDFHHYSNSSVDTVAMCVNAGCNLELSSNLVTPVYFSMCKLLF